jgi:hypothetical protein
VDPRSHRKEYRSKIPTKGFRCLTHCTLANAGIAPCNRQYAYAKLEQKVDAETLRLSTENILKYDWMNNGPKRNKKTDAGYKNS